MPYINQRDRDFFEPSLDEIVDSIQDPGDVCYCVYYMLKKLCEKNEPKPGRWPISIGY